MIEQKLFKWIGGKKWLSENLNTVFGEALSNKQIDTYIEPFAGGLGSFLYTLDTLKQGGIEKAILNDVNSNIINLYSKIQKEDNLKPFFNLYWKLEKDYQLQVTQQANQLHYIKDKDALKTELLPAKLFFENVRSDYNALKGSDGLQRTVMFLFIMKHSFNGLYRENSKGDCNSPFNWKQGVFDKEKTFNTFQTYNKVFNSFNISFENKDVFELIDEHKSNKDKSLFYFDPPYLNEGTTGENKYDKDHFTRDHQVRLLEVYKNLDNVVFSNHYLELFKDFCKDEGFEYQEILRNNVMNPKSTENTKISEILAAKF